MRLTVLATVVSSLLATTGRCDEPTGVAKATKKLRAMASPQAGGKALAEKSYPGALGTTVVMVSIEGAYPGTGVFRVVLDEGVSYGARGDKPLGALAKKQGWLARLPDKEPLLRVVNDAQFDGLLMIDS